MRTVNYQFDYKYIRCGWTDGKKIIRERQLEGIQLAKAKGVYKGRLIGSKEDNLAFLTKHQKSVQLYKKGYKAVEISKINGVSLNTLTKVKKLANI